MKKYKPQHSRLLFIDRKISEGKFPNCSSLATEWEVSSKTIQRDLEYMRYQLDAPLEYSAKNRGYYYTEENFKLPAISIKESDLFAIYLAEELLVQYEGTPFYDNLSSVFKKIRDSLPDKNCMTISQDETRFTVFPPPSTIISRQVWNVVFKGLRTSTQIEVDYQAPGKTSTIRAIDPYHAVRYDGDWYIIAYCHNRNSILTFSLSRIRRASLLKNTFKIPADYDFHQVTKSRFGIHWGEEDELVTIWFSADAAKYILERKWHPSQKITRNDDNSIHLSLTINHTIELKKWVLSWGKDAMVISPENLSSEIKEEIEKMRSLYTSNKVS